MLSVLSETFINSAIIFAVFGVRRASGLHALEPAATQIKMFDGTASPATTLHTSTAATPTPTRPPSDATWTEQHCARAIPTLLVQCSSDTFTENVTRGLIPLKLESCPDDTHTHSWSPVRLILFGGALNGCSTSCSVTEQTRSELAMTVHSEFVWVERRHRSLTAWWVHETVRVSGHGEDSV